MCFELICPGPKWQVLPCFYLVYNVTSSLSSQHGDEAVVTEAGGDCSLSSKMHPSRSRDCLNRDSKKYSLFVQKAAPNYWRLLPEKEILYLVLYSAVSKGKSLAFTDLRSDPWPLASCSCVNTEVGLSSRHSLFHSSAVPNKPYAFCGRKAPRKKKKISLFAQENEFGRTASFPEQGRPLNSNLEQLGRTEL